jgi:hypothetical protein
MHEAYFWQYDIFENKKFEITGRNNRKKKKLKWKLNKKNDVYSST